MVIVSVRKSPIRIIVWTS